MSSHTPVFIDFEKQMPSIRIFSTAKSWEALALEEFARFYTVGGTLLHYFSSAGTAPSQDELSITNVLLRSVLEKCFWLMYVFDTDVEAERKSKFEEYLDGFQNEYRKLHNDISVHANKFASQLEQPNASWTKKSKNVNDLLVAIRNVHGNRLDFLYHTYRITSFYTHGTASKVLLTETFQKPCNFPLLRVQETVDMVANQYCVIWDKLLNP